ncbi:MAG: F0F1 ATP synthase subunit gamma, partial [Deltaproteobacteria bacterium]|nr:F0F1 ATP synthase subunit gamma [Deltaproteobacteria bacterium]
MQMIEQLKRKIKSASDLLSVVKTMKVLAAVSIRQYEKSLESLVEYNRTVEMGLQVVLKQKPREIRIAKPALKERLGAIVFGSDQGMVGQFNEVITRHAVIEMDKLQVKRENRVVLAVGLRVVTYLEETGQPVEEYFSQPGSTAAITPAVENLTLKMEEWLSQQKINQIVIFYNRELGASYSPHTIHLLPVSPGWFQDMEQKPWPSRAIPVFTMDWNRLFSSLIQQYLFVSLYRAFAESLASENAGRLASMQAAERNIEDLLEELNSQFQQQR